MESGLKKKYGLWTAIAMVIGTVIGSGVFFKAEIVLNATGGNLPVGILAWILGGFIMVICAYVFATMATKYEYVNGIVDYAEVIVGKRYANYMGWYMSTVYYPAITSVLAWVSARYTCVLLGLSITGGECMTISAVYLVAVYAMNSLSPVLAGRFQVSTTFIKLIPLLAMAVLGTISGLMSGITVENFTTVVVQDVGGNPLFKGLVSTAFAYEGWIVATSINSELKDSKKNLPTALIVGSCVIVLVYLFYYVGLAGAAPNAIMMENGEYGARIAFSNVFGQFFGGFLFVFVIISCLGTLNGLMMGTMRGMYSLAIRDCGPNPQAFRQVDSVTNTPTNSGIIGLLLCAIWLFFFYGANLTYGMFGPFAFDSSELPIVAVYVFYIPIFIHFITKEKDFSTFKRKIMPLAAIFCCLFMMIAAYFAHGQAILWFMIVLVVNLMVYAYFAFRKKKANNE